jgi:hypothetical protein
MDDPQFPPIPPDAYGSQFKNTDPMSTFSLPYAHGPEGSP